MAVETTNTYSGPLYPNGATTAFPFTFKALSSEEVVVMLLDEGNWSTVSSALYDVTLNSGAGGTVTFSDAPDGTGDDNGPALYIFSEPLFTQTTTLSNQGAFLPAALNSVHDRAALRDQWLKDRVDALYPSTSRLPADRAGYFLGWDAEGDPIPLSGTGADAGLRTDLAASSGAALSGFLQSGTGAGARTAQAKLRDTVSVLDFGADPTGNNDSASAIQAAFDSGARKVVFPTGKYICLSALTAPDWLHIEGVGFEPGNPTLRSVEIRFALASGTGLTCGASPTIRGVWFTNTTSSYDEVTRTLSGNDAAAITLSGNATIEECSFSGWHKCLISGQDTYYLKTGRLQFNRCTYGYYLSGLSLAGDPSYNIHIDAPFSALTNVFVAGIGTAYPRNIKVFGGSIEDYSQVAAHFTDISFFGTYFETRRTGVTAIEPGANGASVALFGCLIYGNGTDRFVNLSGFTNCSLTSHGNTIAGAGPAGGYYAYLPNDGTVSMAGDHWEGAHPNTYRYIDSFGSASRFGGISMPLIPSANDLGPYSGQQVIGQRGFIMAPLTAAPAVTVTGMTVLADNATWDPLSRAGTAPYWTMWNGSAWQSMDGGA